MQLLQPAMACTSQRSGIARCKWLSYTLVIAREETPCSSFMNPRKLRFPSECLIQSLRTT
uniref:Uncharacterized protein n=1 Tax=Zea mays TaxID=4577 RepID=C0PLC0_MAIZE|nr:unknown [Zea mays]